MITDRDTNFVYLSRLVKERPELKAFWRNLQKTLTGAGIKFDFIENTNDLWCRDYMPVQVTKDRFVQFTFYPSYYDDDRWRHLLTDTKKVNVDAVPASAVIHSPILLDGGNLIRSKNTVVLTERGLKENKLSQEEIVQELKRVLQMENVYLIPVVPYEVSGHADGMVRLLDDQTLLVAGYQQESISWKAKYEKALKATGLKLIDFPNVCTDIKNEQGDYAAIGCYINFAWIGNTILFPQFDLAEDREALQEATRIFKEFTVLPVPAADLAMYCGVLNCATWNVLL